MHIRGLSEAFGWQANILVDDQGRACLCDIGLSLLIEPSEFTSIKTAGACRWTAPEIMSPPEETDSIPESESTTLFTLESDIYAFAMTLLEVRIETGSADCLQTKITLHRSLPTKSRFRQRRTIVR